MGARVDGATLGGGEGGSEIEKEQHASSCKHAQIGKVRLEHDSSRLSLMPKR